MIEMVKMEDGLFVPKKWCSFTNPLTSGGKSEIDDIDMKCLGECDGECRNCDLQELFTEYAQMTGQIAVEKQKAKKPIDDTAFGTCPNCHNEFNSELINEYDMKYCIYCGQAIDWRESL